MTRRRRVESRKDCQPWMDVKYFFFFPPPTPAPRTVSSQPDIQPDTCNQTRCCRKDSDSNSCTGTNKKQSNIIFKSHPVSHRCLIRVVVCPSSIPLCCVMLVTQPDVSDPVRGNPSHWNCNSGASTQLQASTGTVLPSPPSQLIGILAYNTQCMCPHSISPPLPKASPTTRWQEYSPRLAPDNNTKALLLSIDTAGRHFQPACAQPLTGL